MNRLVHLGSAAGKRSGADGGQDRLDNVLAAGGFRLFRPQIEAEIGLDRVAAHLRIKRSQ